MATSSHTQQFVLLPARGLRATAPTASPQARAFLASIAPGGPVAAGMRAGVVAGAVPAVPPTPIPGLTVLDSIHEDGAKLVEVTPEAALALRAEEPGLRLVPVVYFRPTVIPRFRVESRPRAAAGRARAGVRLRVLAKGTGSPVAGAQVVAFTDFAARVGAEGTTNAQGEVSLALGSTSGTLQRLYVYPERGFWGALKQNVALSATLEVRLTPVDLAFQDCLRFFAGLAPPTSGQGVTVGIVDTGVDPGHPDLLVAGGENTVPGENPADFGDNGLHHGTHVAGIVAARGTPPAGIRGVAPAVTLRAYRVFPQGGEEASNFAISKAIDRAVADGCDLINLSLGGGAADEATRAAIADARSRGSLVIAAAGNDDHAPVSFPAADSLAIAISAFGRKGTFPSGTTESGDVGRPVGRDPKDFVAAFSNIGPEIDLTGPGVGVLSTVPGGHAPMSGTSMACPAVTGLAARLLSAQAPILQLGRDGARSDAMAQLVFKAAQARGFGIAYEGHGLPG